MRRLRRNTLIAAGVVLTLMQIAGCGEERAVAPTAFVSFSDKEGAFSCKYPEGWEKESGGRSDYSWAKFTKGSAQISISADVTGSLLADISKAASGPLGTASEEPPVAEIHEKMKQHMPDQFNHYREKTPKKVESALGEGRQSEFNATGSYGSRIVGSRTTLLSNDKRITVICTCPPTSWRTLKPAFDTVIKNVSFGQR